MNVFAQKVDDKMAKKCTPIYFDHNQIACAF